MRKDTENVCQISRVPEAVDRCRGRVRTGTRDGTVTDEEGSKMVQPGLQCNRAHIVTWILVVVGP